MSAPSRFRHLLVILADFLAIFVSYALAFLFRFDFTLDPFYQNLLLRSFPIFAAAQMAAFLWFNLYRGIWRYSSFSDLVHITKAVALGSFVATTLVVFVHHGNFPRSVPIMASILLYLGICGVRFSLRMLKMLLKEFSSGAGGAEKSALIIGAGDLGENLLRQMLKEEDAPYDVVGFIDDDAAKWQMRIHGVPVLGGRSILPDILKRQQIDEVIIAISARRGDIVRWVNETLHDAASEAELRIAPSLEEMLENPGNGVALRKVRPADLLNRSVVKFDAPQIASFLAGKRVLVTGAGGTIGAELCRQVLRYGPAKLILLENHATSLFYREMELGPKAANTAVIPVLGDARDQALIDRIFAQHAPQIILHAAAHKHQPQLETNIQEGIQNNILATFYMAKAARQYGAECFLLISTDKAVNPTSVMGATKRVAEMVVTGLAVESPKTRFMAVRFGNVLGSSGSVLRIFQEQIAKGGPITITHPDMTRFFMTVEEAVQLILHAATMAKGGELFILKMGRAVKILDMAKNLILLHGLTPDKDIRIQFTGLRPGEKLDEELMEDPSSLQKSEHDDIMVLKKEDVPAEWMQSRILDFELLARGKDNAASIRKLMETVPTFKPSAHNMPEISAPHAALYKGAVPPASLPALEQPTTFHA